MARIAFYAPLKSPHHPVPSGEREIARNFMRVLEHEGHTPVLASELRTFEKRGDAVTQAALIDQAERACTGLVAQGQKDKWAAWVTYHNYYKAPDLLGPTVSKALGIPYVLIEATRASKRLGGPWDAFERKAEEAIDLADVVFHFTERDAEALRANLRDGQQLVALPPFLAIETLPAAAIGQAPLVLIAGMMRAGDKLASYAIAAEALTHMPDGPWRVEIAGDGPMREEIATLMAPFGERVQFLGQLDAAGMAAAYQRARVFLWPGVNEAFGMAYLEAQAHGVPVVAENRPGVNEVVAPDGLVPVGMPEALAASVLRVLNDPDCHDVRAQAAQDLIAESHLMPAARRRVWRILTPLLKDIP
ncbi:glycosyltransferase family 4 protein [Shimia sp.]|uniref:glycosyltransferase family 4 protein n=1 Tax=Shimia sp. TaxID=1954381 RepID=UPI003B8DF589